MNKVLSNTIHPKDWMVISVNDGIVLKYEGQGSVRLVEITNDNDVHRLRLSAAPAPDLCERDAWLIARVIIAMLRDGNTDTWEGISPLLPISFDGFDVANLRALAALAYCCHTPQPTLRDDDEEEEEGYLHHVNFDGDCWMISVTKKFELDFIQKV